MIIQLTPEEFKTKTIELVEELVSFYGDPQKFSWEFDSTPIGKNLTQYQLDKIRDLKTTIDKGQEVDRYRETITKLEIDIGTLNHKIKILESPLHQAMNPDEPEKPRGRIKKLLGMK